MPLHLYYRGKEHNPKPSSSSPKPPPPPSSPARRNASAPRRSSICPKFISGWMQRNHQHQHQHQQQQQQQQQQQMPGGEKELGKIMQLHKEEEDQMARRSPVHTRTPSPRSLDGILLPPPSPSPPTNRRLPATLLCRRSDGRVLYMEAGKDLVDALLGLLTLPLGAALKLLFEDDSTPRVAISAVYTSALELDESLLSGDRDALVDPRPGLRPSDLFAPASSASASGPAHIYYKCSNHGCLRFVIDVPGQICPVCKFAMSHKLELILPGKGAYPPPSPSPAASPLHGSGGSGKLLTTTKLPRSGFVKKNRTFIVTDELEILPMSTIRSVILLGKLKLDSLQDLESVQVTVGTTEMLGLLKASMSSRTALNDVFRVKGVPALEN